MRVKKAGEKSEGDSHLRRRGGRKTREKLKQGQRNGFGNERKEKQGE